MNKRLTGGCVNYGNIYIGSLSFAGSNNDSDFHFWHYTWWDRFKHNARLEIIDHEADVRAKLNEAITRVVQSESQIKCFS